MSTRRLPLILPLLALPALIGCGGDAAGPPPVDPAALAAIAKRPGVGREDLARAVDALFADEEAGETRALVVYLDGRIVAERYAPNFGRDTRFPGDEMATGITAAMTGLLVADGRLRLDETAPVAAWQRSGDPRGAITVRQLLQMRSGLRHTETTGPDRVAQDSPRHAADDARMLYLDGRDDMAAFAEARPLETLPGRQFEYSTANAIILADLAAAALTTATDSATRRQAVGDYLRTRLLEPVGARSLVAEYDAHGTLIGGAMMYATARDWGRFGEFLRNGGAVKGAQIVPRAWLEFMTKPSPRNPGYGAGLWLNRPQADDSEALFPGRAPASLFACIGAQGQYLIASPAQKLTVVRLGRTPRDRMATLRDRMVAIVGLFPKT